MLNVLNIPQIICHTGVFCWTSYETLVNIILLFRGSEKPTFFEIFVIFLVEKKSCLNQLETKEITRKTQKTYTFGRGKSEILTQNVCCLSNFEILELTKSIILSHKVKSTHCSVNRKRFELLNLPWVA